MLPYTVRLRMPLVNRAGRSELDAIGALEAARLLSKCEFGEHPWLSGMHTLRRVEGCKQLGLRRSGPDDVAPPLASCANPKGRLRTRHNSLLGLSKSMGEGATGSR